MGTSTNKHILQNQMDWHWNLKGKKKQKIRSTRHKRME